jgi:DNA-binding MarR family transcriptional regulator
MRQRKNNFGPKAEPVGVRLAFTEERISVDVQELGATELAEESTLNAGDRVLLTLKDGPAYPEDIAERCDMPLGTVKNELTKLRKRGLVEDTGKVKGQARQVHLTEDGRSVTGVTDPIEACDAVTLGEGSPLTSVYVNERGEAEF